MDKHGGYRGIPNTELSFNLLNEPNWQETDYIRVFGETIEEIRKVDPASSGATRRWTTSRA